MYELGQKQTYCGAIANVRFVTILLQKSVAVSREP